MAARPRPALRTPTAAALVTAVASALLILGPALRGGYVLVGDMVFVPKLPLTGQLIGLSPATPRAVPSDAVVALLSVLLPGQVVQKLLLLAILVATGAGAGLVIRLGTTGTVAATLAAMWNPFVAERLAAGQWAVLVGYAALPWVLRGAWEWGWGLRGAGSGPGRRSWRRLAVPAVLGSLGGAPAWLLVVLGAAAGGVSAARWRLLSRGGALVGGLLVALALPWAVPALIRPGGTATGGSGAVFAPRADTPFGLLLSVVTGGGIWNADVVPSGRNTIPGALGALAVVALGVAGLAVALRRDTSAGRTPATAESLDRRRPAAAACLAGVVGLALTVVVAVPTVGQTLAGWPATAVLRDGARQVGPWVIAVSVGIGVAVDAAARSQGFWRRLGGAVPALLLALLPVAALPSLAWGLSGRWAPVEYPSDYRQVAALVADRPDPGAVVVLPFEAYRRFAWNHRYAALDPLPRWLPTVTVASSDLVVRQPDGSAVRVPGEDRFADQVRAALQSTRPATSLGTLGVRWVVVDQPGVPGPPGATLRWAGRNLRLFEVPTVDAAAARDPGRQWRPATAVVVLTDLLVVLLLTVALAVPRVSAPW